MAVLHPSVVGKCAPNLPGSQAVISEVGKNKCLQCQCQKQASLLPSQLFPFPSILLTVLENDAVKGKSCKTREDKISKAIIQNRFYSTYTVAPSGRPLYL